MYLRGQSGYLIKTNQKSLNRPHHRFFMRSTSLSGASLAQTLQILSQGHDVTIIDNLAAHRRESTGDSRVEFIEERTTDPPMETSRREGAGGAKFARPVAHHRLG